MDFSDLECGICSNVFSDEHCPMNLPCSHTFCGCCIDELISNQNKTCPVCREGFTAVAAKELMISRIALNMAKQFSSKCLESETKFKSTMTPSRLPKGDLQVVINDFKKKITKDAIEDFQGTESQILGVLGVSDEMIAGVIKTDEDIDRIMKELQEVKTLITEHLTIIHQSILIWKTNLAIVQAEKEKIIGFEEKLDNCESFKTVGVVMGEVEDALHDGREEISEFIRLLQKNEKERHDWEKGFLSAEVRLKKVLEEAAKTLDASPQDDVTDNDLQSCSDALKVNTVKNAKKKKKKTETGREEYYIIKKHQGKQRVAPAKRGQNNLLFVTCLYEGKVPKNWPIIEVDSLMARSSRRAFLDLSFNDTHLGRIIIKVIDMGNYALHFLHLCAGDLGPSYVNSRVSSVQDKGMDGEYIRMGEYIKGGSSSKEVLSGVDWVREQERHIYQWMPDKAGQVGGSYSSNFGLIFSIITRDLPSRRRSGIFGMVEEGLDVLRDAISSYPDIAKVKITDCGLIFSL